MILFRKITEENFTAVLNMKRPEGEGFVASNCYSLAQAWLYREDGDVYPFAVYFDNVPVGFMMLEEDREDQRLWLWRIMVSQEYSGKGYGSEAIRLLIKMIKEHGKYHSLYLDCNEKNAVALHIYQKLGFRFTGDINHGDMEMRLDF